ncbi:AAA-domain-containing protein [Meira miltonrushii]|uniref:AAA-domain-containing protein n=1 Tax=Meira miltonrushii TaxID=1280837 RepID=A0A316VDL1_9BASI|nr:AAA-domain-containing protein [Meira miltonrushii]PWN35414.1 AAA-domain-containing protein [Meira miltonrushii]
MPSSNAVDPSSTASPAGSKRRKGGSGLREGFGGGSTSKSSSNATMPTARLKDLGGVTNALDKILELIAMPLCHPEIYSHTGVKPPRGVLLHGPPGCGKTMLAGALAGELNVPLLSISSPSIVSGTSGESEQTLRKLFDEAITLAPCILFLDEIDAITPKRETASREMERRIVAQLLTLLDDLTWDKTDGKPVMVIGATNRPDSLDPALRRAGRFDHEIALGVPDEAGREEILRILCNGLRLSGDFDLRSLAKQTPGYVGADLVALTAAAGIRAVKRIFSELAELVTQPAEDGTSDPIEQANAPSTPVANEDQVVSASSHALPSASLFEALPPSLRTSAIATFLRYHPTPLTANQLERLQISPQDFLDALPSIQPSSKREGFATVPEVTWSDIGALEATREELEMTIVEPIKHPELFKAIGVSNSGGVLLWGPPGCGKTLLAKAVANESGANFISVKGPELLNKYVGESERAVRQVFARARTSSPCVIFFDELDALVPRRDDSLSESSSRVVNTLLTELDGLEARVQTYVIGATNRPDMIDPAMCRPGRLDKLLYVDLPNTLERIKILMTLTQKTPLQRQEGQFAESMQSFGAEVQADRCDGFSGADLAALVREASVLALREKLKVRKELIANIRNANLQVLVGIPHFHAALDKTQPSVGVAQRRKYESLRSRLSGLPGASNATRSGTRPGPERGDDGDLAT